ncbi:MAG: WD40 repeat domain-containing protein, partial [candidate division KSB1 bacterium]
QENLVRDFGNEISAASFSADGKYFLTASRDETIRRWDTSRVLRDSLLHSEEIPLANFAVEGDLLVPVRDDDELLRRFKAHADVYRASLSFDKKRVLTFMRDGSAKLWNEQDSLLRDLGFINSAAFSPVDNRLIVAATDNVVRFCDANGNVTDSLKYHAEINQVTFSPEGKHMLTASHDHTAKLWDLSQQLVHRLSLRGNAVKSAAFALEGKHVLTAGFDSTVVLWNERGERIDSLKHEGVINAARFSEDGKRVLSAGRDGTAKLWTLDESHEPRPLQHRGEVYTAVFSPNNGAEILTASADSTAKLWKANGDTVTFRHNGEVNAAVFSPDGQHVLTASRDSTAKLWLASGDTITFRHNGEVTAAIFSPRKDSRILTASKDSTAKLWRSSGELIKTLRHGSGVRFALYFPRGRYFLTAAKSLAMLWDEEGNLINTLEHKFTVTAAAFSPEEKYILTATSEGSREEEESAVLWNIKGERLVHYGEHSAQVNALAFSPDGLRFITASSDGDARIWWLPETIFAWLKNAPVHHLTEKEREQFEIGK